MTPAAADGRIIAEQQNMLKSTYGSGRIRKRRRCWREWDFPTIGSEEAGADGVGFCTEGGGSGVCPADPGA